MINSNQRYFVCLESFNLAAPHDYNISQNAFITNAYYSSLTYNGIYSYSAINQFTASCVYPITLLSNGDIITHDDTLKEFNITQNNCESKFLEIKLNLTEREIKAIDNLEKKGYFIDITPSRCEINREQHSASISLFCIYTNHPKKHLFGFTEYTTDIILGLDRAIKRYRKRSKMFKYLESAIQGKYYVYVKNSFRERYTC